MNTDKLLELNQLEQDGLSVYANSLRHVIVDDEQQDVIGLMTQATLAVNNAENLVDGIRLALHHIRRYAGAELAEVWLLNKQNNLLVRQAVSFDQSNRAIANFVSDKSVASYSYELNDQTICQVSASYVINDDLKTTTKAFRSSGAISSGLVFNLLYPIVFRETLIGVAIIHHYRKPANLQELIRVLKPISQQLAAAVSLNRLHNRLDTMLDIAGDAICILDTKGRFRTVNKAFADILEYAPEYFSGRQVFDFIHPDHEATARDFLESCRHRNTNSSGVEYLCITKSGNLKWLSCSCTYLEAESLILTCANDVTDKKEATQRLALKTGELNNLVSSLDDVVFEYDKEGNFCNKWYSNSRIFDWMPREYTNKSMQEAYHAIPAFTGPFIEDFEKALTDNEIAYRDFDVQKDNEIRWFNSKITPLYLPSGETKGFSQRITEITEKKKVDLAIARKNDELKSAHRELREIFENSSEIIIKLDTNDQIIFVSPEFEDLLATHQLKKSGIPFTICCTRKAVKNLRRNLIMPV